VPFVQVRLVGHVAIELVGSTVLLKQAVSEFVHQQIRQLMLCGRAGYVLSGKGDRDSLLARMASTSVEGIDLIRIVGISNLHPCAMLEF